MYVRCHIFSFTKSSPSTVEPGKESLTSTLGSQQLDGQIDQVAALGSSLISCIALGVRTPVTLTAEFLWVVTPGACLGKLSFKADNSANFSYFLKVRYQNLN